MSRKLLAFPCISCICLLILISSPRAAAQAGNSASANAPLITQAVDESNLVTLRGNTHPLALPQYDQGAVSPDLALHRMLLVLKRSPAQEAALDQLLDEQQDNSSPNYHQWLTPQQFGQQFGPTDQDIQTITTWLGSHGFQVASVSHGRVVIEFSGTAGQVADAFHTTIHNYSVNGEHHYANSSDPQIPAALAPAIAGVRSLHDFPPKPMNEFVGTFRKDKETGKAVPVKAQFTFPYQGLNLYGLGPYDLATIYNFMPLWSPTSGTAIDGTGVTIAIVGETDINPADWTAFWNMFGVTTPKGTLNVIHPGPDPGILTDGEEGEADIDTQWSSAVARGATIDFVVSESTETTFGTDLSAEYIVDTNLAPVMSESYGVCELGLGTAGNAYFNAIWQQASAQGISVFLAAGDSGSATCDRGDLGAQFGLAVSGYASTPYNVAVGGTDFNDLANASTYWNSTNNANGESAKSYIPEMTWNGTCTNAEWFPIVHTTGAEQTCAFFYDNGDSGALVPTGGGGGVSACTTSNGQNPSNCSGGYSKPSWQTGSSVPNDDKRDLPDVSLFASNGFNGEIYIVCESDVNGPCTPTGTLNAGFSGYGGTSVSSPAFAGIMALVIQKNGGERQGNPNYVFYKMAAGTGNSCNSNSPTTGCVFYDIPSGSTIAMPCVTSSMNCTTSTAGDLFGVLEANGQPAYNTGTGFDLATGLGSVNVENLVNNWSTYAGQFKATKFSVFTLSPTTATHGQAVTVSATVVPQTGTGTPTGTITLIANDDTANQQAAQQVFTLNSSGSLPSGTTTIMLPGGTSESITAHYSGDSTFAPSDSSPFTVTVNPEPSKSSVQVETQNPATGQIINSNATSFVYGTPTILRANVGNASGNACAPNGVPAYGCPTGAVTLNDTFNPGTGPTTSPIAGSPYTLNSEGYTEDQSLFLFGGTHSIVASYSGDKSYNASSVSGSSATPDVVTVTPAPTSISASNSGTTWVNQNAALYATLSASGLTLPNPPPSNYLPSQNVQFYDASTLLSGTTLYTTNYSASTGLLTIYATLNTSFQTVGNHTISAKFPGDSNYAASGPSNSVTVDVQIPTTLVITTSNASVQVATPVTFTATVTPTQTYSQSMTGTVTFTGGPNLNVLGTANLTNGQAQFTTSSLPAGSYTVNAQYSGDTNYAASSSLVVQTVNAIGTTTSIAASSTMISQGTNVTLTATIAPSQTLSAVPTGTVQFLYSDIGTSPVSIVNNQAQFTTSGLPVGSNAITARYSGDSNYSGSQSAPVTVTVIGPPTFMISANPTTISVTAPGQSGSTTLTFTSQNGYAGTIPLASSAFSGLPSETTCGFSPTSVSLTGSGMTATATATCQTTAASGGLATPSSRPRGDRPEGNRRPGPGAWRMLLVVLAVAAALYRLVSLAGIRAASKPRGWRVAFAAFALAALIVMGSCGGGSSTGPPPPPPNPGTPVGLDSNVKVTFSGAGVSPSPTLSLSINVQ